VKCITWKNDASGKIPAGTGLATADLDGSKGPMEALMRRALFSAVLALLLAAPAMTAAETVSTPAGQVVITTPHRTRHRVVRRWVTRRVVVRQRYYRHGHVHYRNRVVYRRYPVYESVPAHRRDAVVLRIRK
jgi:hypothetical protein